VPKYHVILPGGAHWTVQVKGRGEAATTTAYTRVAKALALEGQEVPDRMQRLVVHAVEALWSGKVREVMDRAVDRSRQDFSKALPALLRGMDGIERIEREDG
jgi:hypothetical protein